MLVYSPTIIVQRPLTAENLSKLTIPSYYYCSLSCRPSSAVNNPKSVANVWVFIDLFITAKATTVEPLDNRYSMRKLLNYS